MLKRIALSVAPVIFVGLMVIPVAAIIGYIEYHKNVPNTAVILNVPPIEAIACIHHEGLSYYSDDINLGECTLTFTEIGTEERHTMTDFHIVWLDQ